MTESFKWDEDTETKRVTVEVPASVTADDVKRALEVLAAQESDDGNDLRERHDRNFRA